jgi:GNAT superfamily N-acetyltransferase
MDKHFEIIERMPIVEEYQRLRQSVGWHTLAPEQIAVGLKHSLFSVTALHQNQAIGCGRIVGDSQIYFYIHDVIVMPPFQGQGLGRLIMDKLMNYINLAAPAGAFIGLKASAPRLEQFYGHYGLKRQPDEKPFMEMWNNGH